MQKNIRTKICTERVQRWRGASDSEEGSWKVKCQHTADLCPLDAKSARPSGPDPFWMEKRLTTEAKDSPSLPVVSPEATEAPKFLVSDLCLGTFSGQNKCGNHAVESWSWKKIQDVAQCSPVLSGKTTPKPSRQTLIR